MNYTIGADPEVFVGDGGGVRSIIGKIGGTKQRPLELPLGDGFAVQEDNVALEFNIPPAHNRAEFVASICKATGFLESLVKDKYGYQFVHESAKSFPIDELNTPEAFVFGCDPDYNCWTKRKNPRPNADDPLLRSCGGHVHIGIDNDVYDPATVGKACDLFLGVPSTLMDHGELRKKLYGKHGAIRVKSYGIEYRVLSNFWIFKPELIEWVYDSVGLALDAVNNKMDFDSEYENIVKAIDNNDKDIALQLVNKYNLRTVNV